MLALFEYRYDTACRKGHFGIRPCRRSDEDRSPQTCWFIHFTYMLLVTSMNINKFNIGNTLFRIKQHRTMRSWTRLLLVHCITVLVTMVAGQSNLTPTLSPVSVPTNGLESNLTCISNLTDIEALMINKSPFIEETYVICPNKTYIMYDGTDESANRPILPRSKSVFKCGEDGKSSNSCILTGGIFQILSDNAQFNDDNIVGVVFQGFTLVGGTITSALLVGAGDHTFIDCIFQVRLSYVFCCRQESLDVSCSQRCCFTYGTLEGTHKRRCR